MSITRRGAVPARALAPSGFHARITPNCALSSSEFSRLVLLFTGFGLFGFFLFRSLGAPPAGILAGAEGLALATAFLVWKAAQNRHEDVSIGGNQIAVTRTVNGHVKSQARMAIGTVSVERTDDPDFGCLSLHLREGRNRHIIAADLSPHERAVFADAFCAAIAEAHRKPRINRTTLPALSQPGPLHDGELNHV